MTRVLSAFVLLAAFLASCATPVPQDPATLPSLSEFSFVGVTATPTVDVENRSVSATVPFATDVHHLVARFVTDGSQVLVGGVVQESGVTENDFSSPVTYTVVGNGDARTEYIVEVSSSSAFASWTPISLAGYKSWQTAVGSADGTRQYGVTADQGGLYRSTDSGHSWVLLSGAPRVSFTGLATNAAGTFLVATTMLPDGSIYTSSDSGATWAKRTSSSQRQWGDVYSDATGTHLLALTRVTDFVYLSSNSGATWATVPNLVSAFYTAVAMDTTGTKYAVLDSDGKLQVSTDSGSSWQDRSISGVSSLGKLSASGDFGLLLAAEPMNGGLYVSTDQGQNWTKSVSAGDHDWAVLTCSRDGTTVLAATTNGALFVSTDTGSNFTAVTALGTKSWRAFIGSTSLATLSAFALDEDPITTNIGFSSHTPRPILSPQNWTSVSLGASGNEMTAVVNGVHIVRSVDSGSSWTEITPQGGLTFAEVVHGQNGSTATIFANAGASSFLSLNGGSSWSAVGPGNASNLASVFGVVDGPVLYGFTADPNVQNPQPSLTYSSDGGQTWTERTNVGVPSWLKPALSSDGSHLVLAGAAGGLSTSDDFGASWTPRTGAGTRVWQAVVSSSDGSFLAAAVNGGLIYTSEDSGATWTELLAAGTHAWTQLACSPDGNKMAAITSDFGGVSYSNDRGKSWAVLMEPQDSYWSSLAFSRDGQVLCCAASNGSLWIGRQ